jgi:hypothetical protein
MTKIETTAEQLRSFYKIAKNAPDEWLDQFDWVIRYDSGLRLRVPSSGCNIGLIYRADNNNKPVFIVHRDPIGGIGKDISQIVVAKDTLQEAVCVLYDYAAEQGLMEIFDESRECYEWTFNAKDTAVVKRKSSGKTVLSVVRRCDDMVPKRYEIYWTKTNWRIDVYKQGHSYYSYLEQLFDNGNKSVPDVQKFCQGLDTVSLPCFWRKLNDEDIGLYDQRTGELYGVVHPYKNEDGDTRYSCSHRGCVVIEQTLEEGKQWVSRITEQTINRQRQVIASPESIVEEVVLSTLKESCNFLLDQVRQYLNLRQFDRVRQYLNLQKLDQAKQCLNLRKDMEKKFNHSYDLRDLVTSSCATQLMQRALNDLPTIAPFSWYQSNHATLTLRNLDKEEDVGRVLILGNETFEARYGTDRISFPTLNQACSSVLSYVATAKAVKMLENFNNENKG